jgi:uncharacterized membrane protein YdjX (TVP38/TMEM64 family)
MRRLAALSVVLVVLFAVFWIVRPISENDVRDAIEPFGWAAAPAFVVVAGLLGVALVPGPLLAGASGLLFGTLSGFVVTLGAAVVSTLLSAAIGARAARRTGVRDTAAAISVRRHPTGSVIVQRLVPLAPDGPFNYAFGAAGITTWPLVLGTLIGSSPRAFAYTALGDSVDDLLSPLAIVAAAIVVLTGAVGALVAVRLRRAG